MHAFKVHNNILKMSFYAPVSGSSVDFWIMHIEVKSTFQHFSFAFAEQDDLKRRNAFILSESTLEDTICVGKPINRHAGNQL